MYYYIIHNSYIILEPSARKKGLLIIITIIIIMIIITGLVPYIRPLHFNQHGYMAPLLLPGSLLLLALTVQIACPSPHNHLGISPRTSQTLWRPSGTKIIKQGSSENCELFFSFSFSLSFSFLFLFLPCE